MMGVVTESEREPCDPMAVNTVGKAATIFRRVFPFSDTTNIHHCIPDDNR